MQIQTQIHPMNQTLLNSYPIYHCSMYPRDWLSDQPSFFNRFYFLSKLNRKNQSFRGCKVLRTFVKNQDLNSKCGCKVPRIYLIQ